MPRVTWILNLERGRHIVTLDYGVWSGSRTLIVDGVIVDRQGALLKLWSEQAFTLGTSQFLLTTWPALRRPWSLIIELHNAGRVIPPSAVTR